MWSKLNCNNWKLDDSSAIIYFSCTLFHSLYQHNVRKDKYNTVTDWLFMWFDNSNTRWKPSSRLGMVNIITVTNVHTAILFLQDVHNILSISTLKDALLLCQQFKTLLSESQKVLNNVHKFNRKFNQYSQKCYVDKN